MVVAVRVGTGGSSRTGSPSPVVTARAYARGSAAAYICGSVVAVSGVVTCYDNVLAHYALWCSVVVYSPFPDVAGVLIIGNPFGGIRLGTGIVPRAATSVDGAVDWRPTLMPNQDVSHPMEANEILRALHTTHVNYSSDGCLDRLSCD